MSDNLNLFWILITFVFFSSKEKFIISAEQNTFSMTLVDENIDSNYVRPTKIENEYLYIVTGEESVDIGEQNRYIIKFDIDSAKLINKISYKSNYGFKRGEPYPIGNKYMFISTFYDSTEEY